MPDQVRVCEVDLSIVVPTYGRTSLCRRSLLSLGEALKKTPSFQCEVIVGVNGRDPETSKLLCDLAETPTQFQFKVLEFPEIQNPSSIRNRLVEKATGTWVYFSDDDAYVTPEFFESFFQIQKSLSKAVAIGGPNLTPPESNRFQRATGLTLSSKFATYFSSARYKKTGMQRSCNEHSLILCNLFVRRAALQDHAFLDDLVCCEENWLLQCLKNNGKLLIYDPSLSVWHDRRPNLKMLVRQVFRYGFGRAQIINKNPREITVAHVLPVFCVGYTLIIGIFACLSAPVGLMWISPFIAYPILCIAAALLAEKAIEDSWQTRAVSALLFPVIHVSYGLGLLWGIIKK